MSELISRQDAVEALTEANLKKHMDSVQDGGQENRSAIRIIMQMPTADVVKVVRCKDCKYNPKLLKREQTSYWKPCDEFWPEDNYYCWCGEPNCNAEMRGEIND